MDKPRPAVAILVEDGFDDHQLTGIIEGLATAQVDVVTVGPIAARTYTGRSGIATVTAELTPGTSRSRVFAAVVIPGGYAADRIRMRHGMLDIVREAVAAGCPVAAIGHGPQVLISAAVIRGRTVTAWPSIAVDVKNAGGLYVDRPVVEDGGLITARKLDDLTQFVAAIVRGVHPA